MAESSIILSTDQQEAFEALQDFVRQKESDTLILNGHAGTGKTTLIRHFAAWLQEERISFSLLASTGRASAVLRGKTQLETQTLHGAVYVFQQLEGAETLEEDHIPDHASAPLRLRFQPRMDMESTLFLVDEASMIGLTPGKESYQAVFGSGSLLVDFFRAIGSSSRVIFIGDNAQLPPITDPESPALSARTLTDLGRRVVSLSLTTNQRVEAGNDLRELQRRLLHDLKQPVLPKWVKLPVGQLSRVSIYPNNEALFTAYFERAQAGVDCIAIANSNRLCHQYNQLYRQKKYGTEAELLYPGEQLLVQQNCYLAPLTNGDFVHLQTIESQSVRIRNRVSLLKCTVKPMEADNQYSLHLAQNPLQGNHSNFTSDEYRELMIDFSQRMRKQNIRTKDPLFQQKMETDPYLNALRVGYGYVITCHKSQGGEWDDVFLLLDKGMYAGKTPHLMLRWWYTAVTRARVRLHVAYDWWIK